MNICKQDFENLIYSIYPQYSPHISIRNQLGNICTYLFIRGNYDAKISQFQEECQFHSKYGFWFYYLYHQFTDEDITIAKSSVWFMDDFSETILWDKTGYEIEETLKEHNIILSKDNPDPENGLFWIYFDSIQQAQEFIQRLNQFLISQLNSYLQQNS